MDVDEKLLKKLFIVPVTAIVVRDDGKFLIMKRAEWEKAFPGKWTVPGAAHRHSKRGKDISNKGSRELRATTD